MADLASRQIVCPPLWLAGAALLCHPSTPRAGTPLPVHVAKRVAALREAEARWAGRCVYACAVVFVVILVLVLAAVLHGM